MLMYRSQFFVTMKPCPKLDNKHVVFGEVAEGMEAIKRINACDAKTDVITIADCGLDQPTVHAVSVAPPVGTDPLKSSHTNDPILTAAEYVCILGLSGDDEADIEDEIKVALEAWIQAADDAASVDVAEVADALTHAEEVASGTDTAGAQDEDLYASLDAEESVLSRLVEALGTTYSAGEHGKRLVDAATDGQLHREAFVRWYLSYVFVGDGDEEGSDVGEEEEEVEDGVKGELPSLASIAVAEQKPAAAPAEKPAVATGGWAGVSWTVRPTETATVAGKSWRCEQCMVSNAWSAPECTACGSPAPSVTAGSSAGGAASGATKPGGSIGSGGFVFGGTSTGSGVSGGGFTFGAPAVAPTPASAPSTGFSFGAPAAAPSKVAPPVKADLSEISYTNDPIFTAAEYVGLLGLSGDDEADIEDEIKVALEAWTQAAGDAASVDVSEIADALTRAEQEASWTDSAGDDEDLYASLDADESMLSRLVEALGTTYSAGEHGKHLVDAARDGQLHREAFVRWYIFYVFDGEEEEEEEEENEEAGDSNKRALQLQPIAAAEVKSVVDAEKPAVAAGGWAGVSWTVRPTETATVAGKSWRCEQCMVSNAWSAPECTACGSSAPLEAAGSSAGDAGSDASKTSGSIGSGGFVFGGTSTSSGVSGGGFTFGAPAVAPTPASAISTGFSFGAPAVAPTPVSAQSTGFSFGAPAAAPTQASTPTSGFSFGSPAAVDPGATSRPASFIFGAENKELSVNSVPSTGKDSTAAAGVHISQPFLFGGPSTSSTTTPPAFTFSTSNSDNTNNNSKTSSTNSQQSDAQPSLFGIKTTPYISTDRLKPFVFGSAPSAFDMSFAKTGGKIGGEREGGKLKIADKKDGKEAGPKPFIFGSTGATSE